MQIGNISRNRFQIGIEYAWETRQVDVEIERRQRLGSGTIENLIDACEPARQPLESFTNLQQDRCPHSLDERGVANELDDVAEALLGPQQDDLADEILACPDRAVESRSKLEQWRSHPPKLVLIPPLEEAPGRQKRVRVVVVSG